MAGNASDVIATSEQVEIALRGILTQLGASGIANGYGSLAEALHELDMWEFVNNQARVTAQLQAFNVRDTAIINKLTIAGAYVKLDIEVD